MSLLSDLQTIAESCGVSVETGVFSGKAPDTYLVITPLSDNFELHADNAPGCETQEARLSLFTKGSYTKLKNALVRALLGADFYITDRRYIGFETETGYHHYAIDVAQIYDLEEQVMATIGLDRLYYAKITENDAGEETYGTPSQLAKAISADLSVELAEATLYADDGASEIVKEFKSGTLSLGIDDIGSAAASDLTGATIDKNKVLISASEDGGDPVAVGFRAKKSNGKYKYYWLYRVKFGIPATNLATKGDSITFSTPTIEGTILRRNKADAGGKHPWKAEALEGDVTAATITNWYKEVYEPTYTTTPEKQG